MKVSIIVPFKKDNIYIRECIEHCLKLDYSHYEIILLPDETFDYVHPLIKVIPTGSVGPAEKRDMAMNIAEGDIFAFIDDDAYPRSDWLTNAIKCFSDERVAVCGPALTPNTDNLKQKASGMVLESRVGGGSMTYRYKDATENVFDIDDYPSCNFLVKKTVMLKLGGFDTNYWPGEDTKLCLDITKKLGKKIVYSPEVVVYHHRRELFKPHLRQIWRYGVQRGHFVWILPETSRRINYFLPSTFIIGLTFGGFTYFISNTLFILYVSLILIYIITVLLASVSAAMEGKNIKLLGLVFTGIILTHFCYGIGFLKGLFAGGIVR